MLRTKAEYIEDCGRKEDHLRARKLASDAELDEYRPAGRQAPKEAWVFYWAQLVGYCRRQEQTEVGFHHEEADGAIVDVLNGRPERVILAAARPADAAGGTRAQVEVAVEVHPKSHETLTRFFHARDWLLLHLADRVEAIRLDGRMTDFPLLERAQAELAYQTGLLAYAACTPGPGLPFPYDEPPTTLPAPFDGLPSGAFLRINEAFQRVNALNLRAAERLMAPPKRSGVSDRPSWSIFFGQLALKLKGISAQQLMRDHPLASLLATVKLGAPTAAEDELAEAVA